MSPGNLIVLRLFLVAVGMMATRGVAQTSAVQTYTLLSGSQLTDDCPICDRVPTVVPISGTFGLKLLDQTPLTSRYGLQQIFFASATTSGPQYQVTGSGIYEVGGEVSVTQELFLNADINNGFTNVNALCISTNGPVIQSWPKIQIQADQTNGTAAQVYRLVLVAVPVPRIDSILTDAKSGDVQLEWTANGGMFEVERAANVLGPYAAVTSVITNTTFIDTNILKKATNFFYRLRPF